MKLELIWNEQYNFLAILDYSVKKSLPLLTVLDDEFEDLNPFSSYPLDILEIYGWIKIGEL